jgi:hypothetical protein
VPIAVGTKQLSSGSNFRGFFLTLTWSFVYGNFILKCEGVVIIQLFFGYINCCNRLLITDNDRRIFFIVVIGKAIEHTNAFQFMLKGILFWKSRREAL